MKKREVIEEMDKWMNKADKQHTGEWDAACCTHAIAIGIKYLVEKEI